MGTALMLKHNYFHLTGRQAAKFNPVRIVPNAAVKSPISYTILKHERATASTVPVPPTAEQIGPANCKRFSAMGWLGGQYKQQYQRALLPRSIIWPTRV